MIQVIIAAFLVVGHGFLQADNLCAQESRVVRVLGTILVCLLQLRTLPVIPCGLPDYMTLSCVCRHSMITFWVQQILARQSWIPGSSSRLCLCGVTGFSLLAHSSSSTSVEDHFMRVAG